MSRFKTAVKFHPRPYEVTFAVDYNVTPGKVPHVAMTVQHMPYRSHYLRCYMPFTLRDAKRLRDWLDTYIRDREGTSVARRSRRLRSRAKQSNKPCSSMA